MLLPDNYVFLVHNDPDEYAKWEGYNSCPFASVIERRWMEVNTKPLVFELAVVPLVHDIPMHQICSDELCHVNEISDWDETIPVPVLSSRLIPLFLSYVHAYTAVDLEAQATAHSFRSEGVIKYLALPPQRNTVSTVESI